MGLQEAWKQQREEWRRNERRRSIDLVVSFIMGILAAGLAGHFLVHHSWALAIVSLVVAMIFIMRWYGSWLSDYGPS